MLAIIVLFLLAVLSSSRSEKSEFWPLVSLLAVTVIVFTFVWQQEHQFPGFLVSAFVAKMGSWVISIVIGLMVGGMVFGGGIRKDQS